MILPRTLLVPVALLVALMTSMVSYTAGIAAAPRAFFGDEDVVIIGPEGDGLPGQARVDFARVSPLRSLPGTKAVSPEIYSLVQVNGRSAFVRGVEFPDFLSLEGARIVDGRMPEGIEEALAGVGFAAQFGSPVPFDLVLPSGYERHGQPIVIVGTFDADGASRDELLVSLPLARRLMDMPPDSGHLIRLRTDEPENLTRLMESAGPVFTYSDVTLSSQDIVVGQPIVMRARLTNWGAVAGTKDVEVHVGDRVAASRAFLVPARSTIPVELPFLFTDVGERAVAINPTFQVNVRNATLQILDLPPRLRSDEPFSVRIVDDSGSSVAGVVVRAGTSENVTDTFGVARFGPRPPGELQILALRDGRTEAAMAIRVDDASVPPQDALIVIHRMSPRDPVSSTSANVTVEIDYTNVGGIPGSTTRTLLVDGVAVAEVVLSGPPGISSTARVDIGSLRVGVHTVSLAGESVSFTIRTYNGTDARIEALLEAYAGTDASGVQPTSTQDAEAFVTRVIGDVRAAVSALALASALLAGLGLLSVLHRHVAERETRVGVLKAVGATDEQVLAIATREAAIIGAIGTVIGVALGAAFAVALDWTRFVWAFGHAVHPSFQWYEVALLLMFGTGFVIVATRILLLQTLRNAPDALLRGRALRPLQPDAPPLRKALEGRE